MSHCCKCKTPTARPAQRMCNACHADYMREWRKTHKLEGESRKRQHARAYARTYFERGWIRPGLCCVCQSADAEMHHPDHSKPLFIFWLCRAHHLEWHAAERSNPTLELVDWLPAGSEPAHIGPYAETDSKTLSREIKASFRRSAA
jgi:hypothetical protein